jgi:hypothetical protein
MKSALFLVVFLDLEFFGTDDKQMQSMRQRKETFLRECSYEGPSNKKGSPKVYERNILLVREKWPAGIAEKSVI